MVRQRSGVSAILLLAACVLPGCSGTSTVGVGVNQSPPSITSQPMNQSVAVNQAATFSVSATGASPLSFQWLKNGSAISGAVSASYTTPPVSMADNGEMFSVTVMNSLGSQTSNPATLTVTTMTMPAQGTDVTTYKNDLARTGQNLTESVLTTSNVNSTNFGLQRNLSVTGHVDAQPLYLSQLPVGGAVHNVVYVATEHDMVYAFDSDTGAPLWSVSLVPAGQSVGDDHGCGQVSPEAGITATPVIDRNSGPNGTIYVVAMTKDSTGTYHQRIHALDITSGAELFAGPVEVQATYPNNGGHTTFDAHQYKERPGLLLLGGIVYTMWSSHCDISPYTAWIIGYSETTLAQVRVFNLAPNSNGEGPSIWMAGGAPAVDSSGNIYVLVANGVFETSLTNGFPSGGDYGNAFVKLSTANNTLSVADYFEEDNEVSENGTDADLGSGGAMLLPDLKDGNGATRHLAVGAGKDQNIYVVDRDNMGKYTQGSNAIWQELDGVLPGGIWSTPAYFNNTVYFGDVGGSLKAFSITNARLSLAPAAHTTTTFGYPGTAPAVSADGSSNGIVWAAENSSPAVLHAYNAATLAELYNSAQAGSRDRCGNGNKFITPTIADGKVFLGTQNSVCVFGLLP